MLAFLGFSVSHREPRLALQPGCVGKGTFLVGGALASNAWGLTVLFCQVKTPEPTRRPPGSVGQRLVPQQRGLGLSPGSAQVALLLPERIFLPYKVYLPPMSLQSVC